MNRELDLNSTLNGRLSSEHLTMLRDDSGISEEVIFTRGYRTVTSEKELEAMGFSRDQRRAGLLIPLHTVDGQIANYILRPDNPRTYDQKDKAKLPDGTYPQKVFKYEQPKGTAVRVDCLPLSRPILDNPSQDLIITEGIKKADSIASHGGCSIALTGVYNWRGTSEKGGKTILADFEHIAWNGRNVYIAFDSDAQTNPHIDRGRDRLAQVLRNRGATVRFIYLSNINGEKVGVDDWFVANPEKGLEDLKSLAEGPRPEIKAAPPIIELLDDAPAMIRRPLALINGRGYAAVWCWVRLRWNEKQGKEAVIKLTEPEIKNEQRLFILRDDGVIYGDGAKKSLDDLDIEVDLPYAPKSEQTMSTPAVKRYTEGERTDPVKVFRQVVDIVDYFIDFNRSLAPQRTMSELIGCYIMATYYLPGWKVTGYLWPNGDRGSGKTHLLSLITEMAYMGQFTTAGGSFAALRDLADYGATLGVDDAENLGDPRRIDPDKRALLLAGNRQNSSIPLKELDGRNKWKIRHVSTFSFRIFSAIHLPDPVLASRSIIVPLIRTADKEKGNSDPSDYEAWPTERRPLIDDLWSLSLANLSKMPSYWKAAGEQARLIGRDLEPWRAVLALALWLDDMGEDGLFGRIEQLSKDYQKERPNLEYGDWTPLLIKAMSKLIGDELKEVGILDIKDTKDIKDVNSEGIFIMTSKITDTAVFIAEEDELDIKIETITSRRVGRFLSTMRLEKDKAKTPKRDRGWRLYPDQIDSLARSYGLDFFKLAGIGVPKRPSLNGSGPDTTEDMVLEGDLWTGKI